MKLALINDTHFGARNDSLAFNHYFFKFYDEVFFPYLEENNINTLVHLGDIVDRRKFINYNTLRDFREKFVYRLGRMNIDTHVIVGNHDTYWKNTNEINSMTELFSSFDGKHEPWVYSNPKEVEFDGLSILMLPWINDANKDQSVEMLKSASSPIIFGHLEIAGFEMYKGAFNDHGIDPQIFNKFDMVLSGHYHHKSDNGTVYYLGAPYEMTWSDYQDPRGFHVFDTDDRSLEYVRNPYRMFHKIFYSDADKSFDEVTNQDFSVYTNTCVKLVVQAKTNPYWFDIVVDKLYKSNPFNLTIVEDFTETSLDLDDNMVDQAEDTITILNKYIETLEMNGDKKKLQSLLHELHAEAITMDLE
tara:strand:- start:3561 stop:4637 length:1077 start_codon:yes stop_codon:yes gene_type:complete